MNKEQKRKVQLQQRTLNESLTFQTMFGAKQKFDSLTPEIETRIKEELGAPDKPCGVGRADANPKLLLNDT